jgi:hypothetical protein
MKTLDVFNEAIAAHESASPYREILAMGDKLFGGKNVGVAVYKDNPDQPFDYFTVRFLNGKLELVARGKQEPEIAWKVSQDYLSKVSENPRDYIDNPVKLDWDWLKSRISHLAS